MAMKLLRQWKLPGSHDDTVSVYVPSYPKVGIDHGIRISAHGKLWKDTLRKETWFGWCGQTVEWVFSDQHYVLALDNSGCFSSSSDLYLFVDGCEVEDGDGWRRVWMRLFGHRLIFGLLCFCVSFLFLFFGKSVSVLKQFGFGFLCVAILYGALGILGLLQLFFPSCCRKCSCLPSRRLPSHPNYHPLSNERGIFSGRRSSMLWSSGSGPVSDWGTDGYHSGYSSDAAAGVSDSSVFSL